MAALVVLGTFIATSPAGAHGAASASHFSTSHSVVSLGDSIASGEGTLYDWTFDPSTGKWNGPGTSDPNWLGPYPDCHQSPDAYGFLVARHYPRAHFTELACTGSTFEAGIAGPWSTAVPAQFGDWATRTGLNPVYTAANPDLVLVTLGADDVQFKNIVTACIEYSYKHPLSATQCTKTTPDGPDNIIKKDFLDYLPTLDKHLETLISWIQERHNRLGHHEPPVRIVFTTYPNPLPGNAPSGGKDYCPDTWLFYNDQLNYLSSLVDVMDHNLVNTITGYAKQHPKADVSVVNLEHLYDGHQWCAKSSGAYTAPWAYGMSIYRHYWDLANPNPSALHPTVVGQQHIAAAIVSHLRTLDRGR